MLIKASSTGWHFAVSKRKHQITSDATELFEYASEPVLPATVTTFSCSFFDIQIFELYGYAVRRPGIIKKMRKIR